MFKQTVKKMWFTAAYWMINIGHSSTANSTATKQCPTHVTQKYACKDTGLDSFSTGYNTCVKSFKFRDGIKKICIKTAKKFLNKET